MDLNSEEILDLLTPGNLQSKDVQIDFVNKKVYVTAIRENIGFLRQYMTTQGFEYVGETVKVQYNHNCCDCGSSIDFDAPDADPIQCFGLSTSETSSSNNEDNCSPFVTLQKYAYKSPTLGCFVENLVLNLDPGCGCDSGNCSWRVEIPPAWFQVTDLSTSLIYNKLVGGFYNLSVENNSYVLRELTEETYYPSISAAPTSFTQTPLDECPCLLETRNNSKFLNINVLSDVYEDFDSIIEKWNFDHEKTYTFMHLTGSNNICASNRTPINPNGTYVENSVLISQWANELQVSNTVHTIDLEDACYDFSPVSGMALWLDGQDTIDGFQTSGSNIISWTDKSGNGNTGIPNGSVSLSQSDGYNWSTGFSSSNFINCGSGIILNENLGYTVFCVAKTSAYGPQNTVVSSQGLSAGNGAMIMVMADSNIANKSAFVSGHTTAAQTNSLSTIAPPLNTPIVLSGRLSVNAQIVSILQNGDTFVNQPYVFSGSPVSSTNSPLFVGCYTFNHSEFFNGEIAEVIVYTRALSDSEVNQTMNYLEFKYGVNP